MQKPTVAHFFFVVTIGLATLAAFSATTGDEAEVRRRVRRFAERWTHAERPEEIAEFYSSDATHINPQGEWIRGRTNLVSYFDPLVNNRSDTFRAVFDIESVSFLSEHVALVDGSIRIRGMRSMEGQSELFERFTFVMKHYGTDWEIAASRVMFPTSR